MIQRIEPGLRLSEAVVHHGVAYLAGQVPDDEGADIRVQTAQVLASVDALLAAVGSDRRHLLRAEIFLSEMADFAGMNEVWDAWVVPGHAPARATVQARLARPGWRVEIVVTAALRV